MKRIGGTDPVSNHCAFSQPAKLGPCLTLRDFDSFVDRAARRERSPSFGDYLAFMGVPIPLLYNEGEGAIVARNNQNALRLVSTLQNL